jgi:hypothetical protein
VVVRWKQAIARLDQSAEHFGSAADVRVAFQAASQNANVVNEGGDGAFVH